MGLWLGSGVSRSCDAENGRTDGLSVRPFVCLCQLSLSGTCRGGDLGRTGGIFPLKKLGGGDGTEVLLSPPDI